MKASRSRRNCCETLFLCGPSEQQIAPVRNAYDDCIASLIEELGRLIDELEHRALLDRTWVVIISADHGESFGEHPGVFRHGMSLYQTERHVPLVIDPLDPGIRRDGWSPRR